MKRGKEMRREGGEERGREGGERERLPYRYQQHNNFFHIDIS